VKWKSLRGRKHMGDLEVDGMVESSRNVMAHGDAREGKWSGNWRMKWVASNLHTTSEHGVSSITPADAHTSAASSRLNWRPRRSKWNLPFRRKRKSGFCACGITFQKQSNTFLCEPWGSNASDYGKDYNLGCDAVQCGRNLPTFQSKLLTPSLLPWGWKYHVRRNFHKFLPDWQRHI
jgi:hypothetical protein